MWTDIRTFPEKEKTKCKNRKLYGTKSVKGSAQIPYKTLKKTTRDKEQNKKKSNLHPAKQEDNRNRYEKMQGLFTFFLIGHNNIRNVQFYHINVEFNENKNQHMLL